ncbi:MAG: S-layer homology domain-containing protein, partial [Mycobacterium leprae]
MDFRRITASVAVTALLLGATAAPAMAKPGNGNGNGNGNGKARISQQFQDMGGYEWGLSDVVRMQAFGIFKGRGASEFAPGAKITNQESAVAIVRLIGKEEDSLKLSFDESNQLLKGIPDQGSIAVWARPAVAMLVKEEIIPGDAAFSPLKDATRLQIAERLVKALGFDAEAQAKMNVTLSFKDASAIPADKVGYVATAVAHKLVTGYAEDNTFRPSQPVRRVEMAVMMGRADNQIDRHQKEVVKGVVKSVDVANNAFTFTNENGQDATVTLADDASVFVNGTEKDLSAVAAGMNVVLKLDDEGKVEFVNAKTPDAVPDQGPTGPISAITPATATSLGLITVNSTVYPVAVSATVTLNGAASTLANLQVGDQVKLTVATGLVTKIEATRQVAPVVVNGAISLITPATATAPASLTVNNTVYL